ncbi:MAG: sigma-70 family RNA polymerase sigma factor [Bacteroidota bacterium]
MKSYNEIVYEWAMSTQSPKCEETKKLNELFKIDGLLIQTAIKIVVSMGGDKENGRDIAQEGVAKLIKWVQEGKSKYENEKNLKNSYFLICRRLKLDEIKHANRIPIIPLTDEILNITYGFSEEEVDDPLFETCINQAFIMLKPRQKQILTYFYRDNLSYQKIVNKMKFPNLHAATQFKFLALKKLRKLTKKILKDQTS